MTTAVYAAIVEGDQDGGYSAFFPDLPGCVTAAETQFELMAAAREALALHLSGMIEDGDPLPEPTALEALSADQDVREVARILVDADVEEPLVRVNVSIGAATLRRIDVAAEARGMTRSGFLVAAARGLVDRSEAGQEQVVVTQGGSEGFTVDADLGAGRILSDTGVHLVGTGRGFKDQCFIVGGAYRRNTGCVSFKPPAAFYGGGEAVDSYALAVSRGDAIAAAQSAKRRGRRSSKID